MTVRTGLLKNVVVMAIIVHLLAAAGVVDEAPLRVGGDVARPEKISAPPPVYTEQARKARLQGVVIVEAIIDTQGNVVDAHILKGMPMGLDLAALDAVEKWKFKPATLEGKPVKVYYTLTVNFKLQ
jgi:protein TonB